MDTIRTRMKALEKRIGAPADPGALADDERLDVLYEHCVDRVEQAHQLPEPYHYGYARLLEDAAREGKTPLEYQLSRVADLERFMRVYEAVRGAKTA